MTEEEMIGYRIVMKALKAPIKQIAENSGVSGEEIIAAVNANVAISGVDVFDVNYGYNFLTNEYGDLVKMGVVDPTKVVKNALKNAASVAGTLLTTEVCIVDHPDDVVPPARTPRGRSE